MLILIIQVLFLIMSNEETGSGEKKDCVNHEGGTDGKANDEQQIDDQKLPKSKRQKIKDKDAGKKELKNEPISALNMNMLQSGANMNVNELTELARRIQIIQASTSTAAKDPIEAKHHTYQFWQTQPVPAFGIFLVLKKTLII